MGRFQATVSLLAWATKHYTTAPYCSSPGPSNHWRETFYGEAHILVKHEVFDRYLHKTPVLVTHSTRWSDNHSILWTWIRDGASHDIVHTCSPSSMPIFSTPTTTRTLSPSLSSPDPCPLGQHKHTHSWTVFLNTFQPSRDSTGWYHYYFYVRHQFNSDSLKKFKFYM